MLAEVCEIWHAARSDKFAPSWKDIGFESFSNAVIPMLDIADVNLDPFVVKWRFVGTGVTRIDRIDYTNKSFEHMLPTTIGTGLRAQFKRYADDPKPDMYVVHYDDGEVPRTDLYVGLRLPLSDDGRNLHQSLCVTEVIADFLDVEMCFDKAISRDLGAQSPGAPV